MNSMNKQLSEKMARGELCYGSHIFGGLPIMTEAVSQCGYDVLWIDMEHTGIGTESVINNMIAARAGGTPAWVRVPWNDPVRVKPIIDMGADGIIFPYIRTVEDAELAVASCTYPPDGIRGYGPLRALDYGKITQMDFVKKYYRDCKRVIQIEHIDAVKNLREIAKVKGIDAFIVGPNDLSASVGKIGLVRDPELIEIYKEICAILKEAKIPFGMSVAYNKEVINEWVEMGATLLFCGSDTGYVNDGAMATLKTFQKDFPKK